MIRPDEEVPFTLTAADLNIVFAALQELPYKASASVIDRLRARVLAHDATAFDPPTVNGGAPEPAKPNGDAGEAWLAQNRTA